MATVAVIVVNWNTRDLLAECLAAISATAGDVDVETVVVDNGSSDGSVELVRERFPHVRLIANRDNRGFGPANNQAIAATDSPFVLMLNSDARLLPGTLGRLLARLESAREAGLVGAQLRDPDGAFQFSHAAFPSLGREALILSGVGRLLHGPWYPSFGPHANGQARAVDWVSGACMLARRAALRDTGVFDEAYRFYGEETDLCYRLRQRGWEVWYEPAAVVIHRGGASTGPLLEAGEANLYAGRMRFYRKHHGEKVARLFAAQLWVLTPPKIVAHALLRTFSGGRRGRRILSLGAMRRALAGTPEPIDRRPSMSERSRPTSRSRAPVRGDRMLVLATASRPEEQQRDRAHEEYPRVDYIELQRRLGTDVIDDAIYPAGARGSLLRHLETQLRSDPYLTLHGLARARRYDQIVCMSERVGIPLAALRRAGALRCRLAVLFQCWSRRQEAAITRLGLFGAIDVIGVISTAMRDRFLSLGAPPERVHLLRWGVDHRFFAPAPRIAGSPFAFTLGETRGRDYPLLFRAVDGLPFELRVLASGYGYAREKRRAAFADVPANVGLLPRVSPTELRNLYAQALFVVLPVHDALYPSGVTAALEAMCMARAVIATRSRGLADYLVDGETCLLVERDATSLGDAMRRLARDPELARTLGENGRRRVDAELNQERYVEQLVELLERRADRSEAAA